MLTLWSSLGKLFANATNTVSATHFQYRIHSVIHSFSTESVDESPDLAYAYGSKLNFSDARLAGNKGGRLSVIS